MIRKTRTSGSHINPMDFCLLNLILDKKIARKILSRPAPRLTPRSKLPANGGNFAYSQSPSLPCGKGDHSIRVLDPRTIPNASGKESTHSCLCGKVAGHVIGSAGQRGKNKSPPPPRGRTEGGRKRSTLSLLRTARKLHSAGGSPGRVCRKDSNLGLQKGSYSIFSATGISMNKSAKPGRH